MIKMYAKVLLQAGAAVGLYYLLHMFIENDIVIVVILFSVVIAIMVYGIYAIDSSPADLLDISVDPDKFETKIEKYKNDTSKYQLLKAYSLVHRGEYDKAKVEYSKVTTTFSKKHEVFIKTAIDLKFAFNNNNKDLFRGILTKAIDESVFEKVNVPNDTFKVHQHVLDKKYKEAEELAKEVIPTIKKRLYIIELEYLLALSYFEQNKLDDCDAVCDFVIHKDYKLQYTDLCKEMYKKINKN